jgi:hypothetical protein
MIDKRKEKLEQVWVDKEFKIMLEKLRAKRILAGENCKSVSEISKKIVENKKIRDIIDKELAFGVKIMKEGEQDEKNLF